MTPFIYPSEPHVRRHGPQGYQKAASYRPWLRDEFVFRCVYCLRREQWDLATSLHVEHFLPTSQHPTSTLQYDNLVYACALCNATKSNQITADPHNILLAGAVTVQEDGTLACSNVDAQRLIAQLRLNSPEMVHFRRLWLEIVAMAECANLNLYWQLLAYPVDLPDLRRLRPPAGNTRPNGIESSYRARQDQGELAELY
jgi:HNH endonuclease.